MMNSVQFFKPYSMSKTVRQNKQVCFPLIRMPFTEFCKNFKTVICCFTMNTTEMGLHSRKYWHLSTINSFWRQPDRTGGCIHYNQATFLFNPQVRTMSSFRPFYFHRVRMKLFVEVAFCCCSSVSTSRKAPVRS